MAEPKKQNSLDRARVDLENAARVFALASETVKDPDAETPEIFIIDPAALPAAYYLRESVVAAVKAEILRDHQAGQPLPAGASLKNEVEARHGETDQISDKTDDNSERRTGSEDPKSGGDNGSETGSSSPDPSGPRS